MQIKKETMKLTTKHVVAIGIGAALYAATSAIAIPVAPSTGLRPAVALLAIFGVIFGPIVGFLVGFIGHALNDAMTFGVIWWSWVFMSAAIGGCLGLITLHPDFDLLKGQVKKAHIGMMYLYAVGGAVLGSLLSYLVDVLIYGEPADKVWLQIIVANITNLTVVAVIAIPVIILLGKLKSKSTSLEEGK